MERDHDTRDDEPVIPGREEDVSGPPEPRAQIPPAPAEAPEEAAEPPSIDQLRAECDDLMTRLRRVSADYLNYQKRAQRDIDEARSRGVVDLAKAVLELLDDLERAIEHARANHAGEDPLLVGTELVHAKALTKLAQFGIEPIQTEGRPFDPLTAEALLRQPTDQAEPMTVLKEVQKGYAFRGRTIRPAKVVVAAPPETPGKTDPSADQ